MPEYDPGRDRGKNRTRPDPALEALLGPEERDGRDEDAAEAVLDRSLIDDAPTQVRPTVTPKPSGLPERFPREALWLLVAVFAAGALSMFWVLRHLRWRR